MSLGREAWGLKGDLNTYGSVGNNPSPLEGTLIWFSGNNFSQALPSRPLGPACRPAVTVGTPSVVAWEKVAEARGSRPDTRRHKLYIPNKGHILLTGSAFQPLSTCSVPEKRIVSNL